MSGLSSSTILVDWAIAAVEQALSHLERNINPTLALVNMILDVREAIRRLAVTAA